MTILCRFTPIHRTGLRSHEPNGTVLEVKKEIPGNKSITSFSHSGMMRNCPAYFMVCRQEEEYAEDDTTKFSEDFIRGCGRSRGIPRG
ncbi:MAG: hypothetical protein WAK91_08725 [Candidatus Acidiferrales bacterium]